MEKEEYRSPEMEIIEFDNSVDVIITSCTYDLPLEDK